MAEMIPFFRIKTSEIMSRKRKEQPLLEGIEITGVAAEGNAIARVDEMVVFVPYGAPGDVADIKIGRKKRNYAEGHIVNLVKPSEIRCEPRCSHFGTCGGCRWQHLPYDYQLQNKQQQVVDALQRIAKVPLPEISPIIGSGNIWEYRNKMEYTFSNKRWLSWEQMRAGDIPDERDGAGFHIPGAFDKVLDIEHCYLQDRIGDEIRLHVKHYGKQHGLPFYDLRAQTGFLRTLIIRPLSTGELMVVVVFGEDRRDDINALLGSLVETFPQITSLM